MIKAKKSPLKIAIHAQPWENRRVGYSSAKWREYWVCVGMNPLGPQGGACGNAVDATEWHGRYSRKHLARRAAERLSIELGAEIVN